MAPPIDFDREIRPILNENCLKCHGPDDSARKAHLRLDRREEVLKATKSGKPVLAPGAPDKSELVARITAQDPKLRMPPLSSGKKLSTSQVETLQRWIAQGAVYAMHWAYVKPARPALPEVAHKPWPRKPLDYFVLAKLEREGLGPSPEADRYRLIRRVSLDLTGLPPTLEEVDRFVNDASSEAYEALVERLLSKTAFGEHWARMWLDLARYADSAGYADDPLRTIWAYRDYVIRSLNADKPFDQFTIEQIAGDLLPEPTEEDIIATAFHRNTMTNNEGGTDDEEFRNAAIVDRVNTTMTVWMATSIACAQCHNHKYDPLSQQEYFRFFAILNNTEDADRTDEAPVVQMFSPEQKHQRAQLQGELARVERQFKTVTPDAQARLSEWERAFPLTLLWQATLDSWQRPLCDEEQIAQYRGTPAPVLDLLARGADRRSDDDWKTLTEYYLTVVDPALEPARQELATLHNQLEALKPTTVPIMRELEGNHRRKTHIQLRGNFRALGEEVSPGVPAVFPELPKGAKADRLALARWLVDESNPLTARVLANRLWEQIFGLGIVRTSEDFGSQGDLPSNPELLDWLACELIAQKWDLKEFLRLLVTSATYRQASMVSPEMQERDPDDVLLARSPRYRLPAEVIRDQALLVSGLLSPKMYGEPVRPPRPPLGLSAAFGGSLDWTASEGEDRYRRALYIEWRRTSPYPSMTTFDAPSREICTVRRPRSNTPLQALVTLNDPVYVEAAQALARRMAQARGSVADKISYGFRLCLARPPRDSESLRLTRLYAEARAVYQRNQAEAQRLATTPLGPPPPGIEVADLAAWTTIGNVLLNLDEFLTRP